jgi:L-glutamine-phosphate cytidylyltransferase
MSVKDIRGIVLAAGRGRRMGDATEFLPKCLQVVHGRPLLDHVLGAYREAGIKDVAIVTGYRAQAIKHRVDVTFHNDQWSTTNMVASLRAADCWLSSFRCIISYSDIFFTRAAIESLRASTADLAVLYDRDWLNLWTRRFADPLVDAETFRLSEGRQVVEIGNRPKSLEEIEGQFMGVLSITPSVWQRMKSLLDGLPTGVQDSIDTTALVQLWIDADLGEVQAVGYEGVWGEVDSIDDLSVYE